MISKFKRGSGYAVEYVKNNIYITPNELLRPYISHYRISFTTNSIVSDTLAIIPDASGCLIFTLDMNTIDSWLWGATTKTVVVKNDVNHWLNSYEEVT